MKTKRVLATVASVGLLIGIVSCAWIEQHDPVLQVNADTYNPCTGTNVPSPGCRTDDQECPFPGEDSVCIDLPPSPCETGPCYDNTIGVSHVADAGVQYLKLPDGGVSRHPLRYRHNHHTDAGR